MTPPTQLFGWRMSLELRQLRALVAVLDEGTFTDAAIALGVSQASVSRSIVALERAVGARVLQRSTRQISLTIIGARIIDHARRALQEAAAIQRAAEGAGDELRVGYAWSALGQHTTTVQQQWAAEHPDVPLIFVQANTPTAGLKEGTADIAVLRRPLDDRRFQTARVGVEARYAAVASDDALARRRSVALADFAGKTIATDSRTGTTTEDLWPPGAFPGATHTIHGVDEWLTLIAAGQAVGITAEATARQYPRPGVTYRPLRDAQPVTVWLAWWEDNPPTHCSALLRLVCDTYSTHTPVSRHRRSSKSADG